MKIKGIHHISNIVRHPQMNVDYNAGLLGLRLIKRAVNFDDAYAYHFYYGNHNADIGTIITAFPSPNNLKEGIKGGGQTNSIYYTIPEGSMPFWEKRLNDFNIVTSKRFRFEKEHLIFEDEAGIQNELVEAKEGIQNEYEFNGVKSKDAIKGFYGALIQSTNYEKTKEFFINILGMDLLTEDNNYYRFELMDETGKYVDLYKLDLNRGRLSLGTVHHIAFTVDTNEELEEFRKKIESLGINVTNVKDRNFFKSIYFKEPGGTIIELATRTPGFDPKYIDERGLELYLPKHFEHLKAELENTLTPIHVKEVDEIKVYKYQNKEEHDLYYYHQGLLNRINELAKIAKTRSLTKNELKEREDLRNKYVLNIRKGFSELVSTIKVEDEVGNRKEIERKDAKWNN